MGELVKKCGVVFGWRAERLARWHLHALEQGRIASAPSAVLYRRGIGIRCRNPLACNDRIEGLARSRGRDLDALRLAKVENRVVAEHESPIALAFRRARVRLVVHFPKDDRATALALLYRSAKIAGLIEGEPIRRGKRR
jgi:hypothetical protein